MIFGNNKKSKTKNSELPEKGIYATQSDFKDMALYDRPRVCTIDLSDECVDTLKTNKYDCFKGTLGPIVEVPNTPRDKVHLCLPNFVFPDNLHEYDIVIIDLQNKKKVPYDQKKHSKKLIKGRKDISLVSTYPETLFDPRALSSSILGRPLNYLMEKNSILIVFADEQEKNTYYPVAITPSGAEHFNSEAHWLYDFYSDMPGNRNLIGKDSFVTVNKETEIGNLLIRHNNEARYTITFKHPTHWDDDNNDRVKDKNFLPLMCTKPDKIISFVRRREKNFTFFFPYIEKKDEFLIGLFERVLPGICPELFPHSTRFLWKSFPEYRLPNENNLLNEKKALKEEFKVRNEELQAKIDANRQEYGFLHDLLTETGDLLVKTIEKYMVWIGFDNVINVDETNPDLKEEDLRVETEKGLLVIEIKGIGGTSTDAECAQVSKFKFRRSKERNAFNVFGLYLVNHQRYLPPNERVTPPSIALKFRMQLMMKEDCYQHTIFLNYTSM